MPPAPDIECSFEVSDNLSDRVNAAGRPERIALSTEPSIEPGVRAMKLNLDTAAGPRLQLRWKVRLLDDSGN